MSKRARIYSEEKNYEKGIEAYTELINLTRKTKNAELYYYYRGRISEEMGNLSGAERDFRSCVHFQNLDSSIRLCEILVI